MARTFFFAPLYDASEDYGEPDEDRGWFHTDHDFAEVLLSLIANLKRSPRLWEFKGIEADGPKAGQPSTFGAWGHTPDEAWLRIHQPNDYVTAKGFTPETQAQWIAQRHMDPTTVTVDDRVWPDPEPDFAGLVASTNQP